MSTGSVDIARSLRFWGSNPRTPAVVVAFPYGHSGRGSYSSSDRKKVRELVAAVKAAMPQ